MRREPLRTGEISMSEWRPITTAPEDTRVLVYGAKRLEWAVAMYTHRDGWQVESCSEWWPIHPPKFWMPLPKSPLEYEAEKHAAAVAAATL